MEKQIPKELTYGTIMFWSNCRCKICSSFQYSQHRWSEGTWVFSEFSCRAAGFPRQVVPVLGDYFMVTVLALLCKEQQARLLSVPAWFGIQGDMMPAVPMRK